MPISSQRYEIYGASEGIKARFFYTLDDGRVLKVGPTRFADEAAAVAEMSKRANDVLNAQIKADAREAAHLGITTAHKQASAMDVCVACCEIAKKSDNPVEIYECLNGMKTTDMDDEALRRWNIVKDHSDKFSQLESIKGEL